MNRLIFGINNIFDKFRKCIICPSLVKFYFKTYILSKFCIINIETYIVSYPKSGRTWLRVFLEEYQTLCGQRCNPVSRTDICFSNDRVIRFEHDLSNWVPAPVSVNKLKFRANKYRDKKVLFLVRDPRDVLVSSYYHLTCRERIYKRDLSNFVRDNLVGIDKIIGFMNMWNANQTGTATYKIVKYEDMKKDAEKTFADIVCFLGLPVNHDAMLKALANSSFDAMKKKQTQDKGDNAWLKTYKEDGNAMKVRSGKIGSYKEELKPEDIKYINEKLACSLDPSFGYAD